MSTPQASIARTILTDKGSPLHALREPVLTRFLNPANVEAWLGAENRHLGWVTPEQAIAEGRIDEVAAAAAARD